MERGLLCGGANTPVAGGEAHLTCTSFFLLYGCVRYCKGPQYCFRRLLARAERMDNHSGDLLHALAHTVDDSVVSQTRTVPCLLTSRALRTGGFGPEGGGGGGCCANKQARCGCLVAGVGFVNQPSRFRVSSPSMPQLRSFLFCSFETRACPLTRPTHHLGPLFCNQLLR